MNERARRWLALPFGVGDGAMGTSLQALGLPVGRGSDGWNLYYSERVQAVHQAYCDAGAAWVQTNTFSATAPRLAAEHLDGRVREINRAAVELARAAAGSERPVLGTIGPIGQPQATVAEVEAGYREQVEALAEAGVDGFLVETVVSRSEGECAVRVAAGTGNALVVACFTPGANGALLDGTPLERAAEAFVRAGASVVGVNCGTGPHSLLVHACRLADLELAPVYAAPSAGLPSRLDEQPTYDMPPELFAVFAPRFQQLGVTFFAGCCGIAPEHIRAAIAATGGA